MYDTIVVNTQKPYDILVGKQLIKECGALIAQVKKPCRVVVITDKTVHALYADAVEASLRAAGFEPMVYAVVPGEESKSLAQTEQIYDFLSAHSITRSDLLVALGGGVVGDLTGFVAATFLRGIDFVQIPTTFLAQIDSSVGGKTGVNTKSGKNLVGAFWQPIRVICDIEALDTLSDEIFCDGIGEAIKYGAIFDDALFALIASGQLRAQLQQVVCRCIRLKQQTVEADERDCGQRQLLNFGHTIGHAVEICSNFGISHGKAVGVGMVLIAQVCERCGITAPGCSEQIVRALACYGMPTQYPLTKERLLHIMCNDKKRSQDKIHFVVIDVIGKSRLHPVSVSQLETFLQPIF